MNKDNSRREFAEKYGLSIPKDQKDRNADFYWHSQSSQWLIKHEACEKIHGIEKMTTKPINVITDDNEKALLC